MKAGGRGCAGQSSAEFALALPLLAALIVGSAQLINLVQANFFCLQAAQVAARVYAVHQPNGESEGKSMATRAAARVLSRSWSSLPLLSLEILPPAPSPYPLLRNDLDRGAPSVWRVRVVSRLRFLAGLSLPLAATAVTLNEDTLARAAANKGD